MNRKLSKLNCRVAIRLLAVLASAAALNLAWATSAQAAGNVEVREEDGAHLLFIDGVLTPFGFSRSDFTGKFTLDSGSGKDLFEFHNATFRDEVDVRLGFGIDGACGFEDSEFQRPHMVRFDGGPPSG